MLKYRERTLVLKRTLERGRSGRWGESQVAVGVKRGSGGDRSQNHVEACPSGQCGAGGGGSLLAPHMAYRALRNFRMKVSTKIVGSVCREKIAEGSKGLDGKGTLVKFWNPVRSTE